MPKKPENNAKDVQDFVDSLGKVTDLVTFVGKLEAAIDPDGPLGSIYQHPERAQTIRAAWRSILSNWLRLRSRFGAMSDFVYWNFWAVGNATIDPTVIAAPLPQSRGLLCAMRKR